MLNVRIGVWIYEYALLSTAPHALDVNNVTSD